MKTLSASAAAIALTTGFATVVLTTPAEAQLTTSEMRGTVTSDAGAPIAGATVTIVDTRTGAARSATTNSSGAFSARNLVVGGPYSVTVSADGFQPERLDGVSVALGGVSNLSIDLASGASSGDVIVVTASRANVQQLAIGPSASFNLETLEAFPSIDRDIRDIIRLDPRVIIDGTNDDNISCIGGNNRFNSFTIDGVRSADGFGLNASGFPNRNNLPLPFDAVRETAVEFSPFDVEYGQFTGCNINVVTKSGTNEFSGAAFGVFNNDGLTGSTIDGDTVSSGEFRDWNWGASLGGPIIKDRLWFFAAYEEVQDGGSVVSDGPVGAGFANEDFLSLETANELDAILRDVYGRESGGIARLLPDESRRILGRVDWQINNDHRLEFTYSRLREERQDEDDAFGRFNDFTFLDNFEIEGTETENYSARLFSQWTDQLSTEIRASRIDVQDLQDPVGGGEAQDPNPLPRLLIDEIDNPNGGTSNFLSGPGFSRSANDLQVQIDQLKFAANYEAGDHLFTIGYELDQLDVFNLFVQEATGTISFLNIDDFRNGIASEIDGQGSFTGDINDAAAEFSRSIHTVYLQDEWRPTDALTLTIGLRYDWYQSDDQPNANPVFEERYGFTNTQAFEGLDIIQPRFGFNYDAGSTIFGETTFRGGVGIFSGGDPTVWFANNFQNFGGAIADVDENDGCTPADLQVIDGAGNFTGIPQCIVDAQIAQASANLGPVNAIDPDFEIPSLIRYNFGFNHFTDFGGFAGGFFDEWNAQVDFIYSQRRNSAVYQDLGSAQIGTAPDGRPIFEEIDPRLTGCNAQLIGINSGFENVTPECFADGDVNQQLILTNVEGDQGRSITASLGLSKLYDFDVANVPSSFNFSFGYAFTDNNERSPLTSSTAGSNFENVSVVDPRNIPLADSPFTNRHNVTIGATYSMEFINDHPTQISLFYNARDGRNFSYVFEDGSGTFGEFDDNEDRALLYIPLVDDPIVTFDSAATEADFNAFVAENGLEGFRGQILPRNAFRDPWNHDMDIRFAQSLPGFFGSDRFQVFADIENFLNLIDDGLNTSERFERGDAIEGVPVIEAEIDGDQFVYSNFDFGGLEQEVDDSVWAVQFGVRYEF
ncbi:MAG: carboxypeptidase regulatory-like domain-containing protein [Pseudomonadota bacterium]